MSYLQLSEIKFGMTLNQVLVSPNGNMILGQGTVINEYLLSCLKEWNMKGIDVIEETAIEINLAEIEKVISDIGVSLTDSASMETHLQSAAQMHSEIETELKGIFLRAKYQGRIPLDPIISLVNMRIYPSLSRGDSFTQLHTDRVTENYLYRHALDVAFLSGYLGRWLGYEDNEVWNLTLAGLLHDIGKTRITFEMLSKPNKLNLEEFNITKFHVHYGCQLIAQTGIIPNVVLNAVLQHHERMDGSGHPYGISGTEVSTLARIVAVADVYDTLISNRYYRRSVSPKEAIQIMKFQMEGQLDTHVLACLSESVLKLDGINRMPMLHELAM